MPVGPQLLKVKARDANYKEEEKDGSVNTEELVLGRITANAVVGDHVCTVIVIKCLARPVRKNLGRCCG
jgi:hypothetical protein